MRKDKCIRLLLVMAAILLFAASAIASSQATQYNPLGAKSVENMIPNGEYEIYVLTQDKWQQVGKITFDKFFRERELDLSGFLSNSEEVKVKVIQKGGGAAHIDSVLLGGNPPVAVEGIQNGLKKLSKKDFDVADAFGKEILITFPEESKDSNLRLTARVESTVISKTPFQFPTDNFYRKMDTNSQFYSYKINAENTPSPFFKEYSLTGSGHPSGYTYGWVSNDDKNLYVKIDFTPDNTMDGDKDYAKVYVKTEEAVKEFKVSVPEARWGSPDFTYTDKVAYQHKIYNFSIPLKEIGVEDVKKEKELLLAFAAYGTAALPQCGDQATPIHDIQGSGLTSPLVGTLVDIEAIVVGDFQNNATPDNGNLNGFYVQEEDAEADANPLTSEGIFVFAPGASDVSVGDKVRVHGTVTEFFGLTEITGIALSLCSMGNVLPTAAIVSLPVTSLDDFERYEGMAVTFPQILYISEYFNFDRFGEVLLTADRQFQPTAIYEPGSSDAANLALANSLSRITLDDGRSTENPDPAIHPNGAVFNLSNLFRGGDTVQNVTGVMDYAFGLYRIQPTQGADYTNANPRTSQPDDVGGKLKVASFNLLSYFTTLDNSGPICGPLQNQFCRGADDANEFIRQRDKIIAALSRINADIVGLIEIENHPGDVPTADLISGLNNAMGAGTYNYIATGAIGSDAIRNALIYKPAKVTPVGSYAILNSTVDPRFLDSYSRPTLAQTFQDNSTHGILTVAVNHLKSKGSDCNAVGDPDTGDGSGNCNLTRKAAAEALVDWLASDPTGSGDADFLIIGDLNSYDKEDPIDSIKAGADDILSTLDDYSDLVFQFIGEYAYSYLFDGQLGYLDHALANASLTNQVTGVTIWHINADEPDLIDYDTIFKQPNQEAIYAPDAYRSSDHDPVIIGLNLACDVNCVSICRTAGFWGTHAGTECPKKQPDCGSQNITEAVVDKCEACLEICGEIITNTDLDSANSAIEAICVSPGGDMRLQLARQLTAASLNCCVSGAGSDCAGLPDWQFIFDGCNVACEEQETEGYQPCIDALDCLNNGGNIVDLEPVTCQTGTCQPLDGSDPVGEPCGKNLPPCPEGFTCISLTETCHTSLLGICADGSICTEENTTGRCYNEDLCDAETPCADLSACKPICDSDGSVCNPGPAGSSNACTIAIGDGKGKNAGNDCAVLPMLNPPATNCSKFNQGEECCGSDVEGSCARTVTVTFNVTVPATTDGTGRSVYTAGSFHQLNGNLPDWNPGYVILTRLDATHWTVTLTGNEGTSIEYNYTLGDWPHVERGGSCEQIANRQLTLSYGSNGTQTVDDTVLNWRNVAPCGD